MPLLICDHILRRITIRLLTGLSLAAASVSCEAEVLTVKQVKDLIDSGEAGSATALSYATGVFDGVITLELMHRKDTGQAREFCGVVDAFNRGTPITHPAFRTKELVSEWQTQGRDMKSVFPDLVINFLSAQYGCKK